MIRCQNIYKSYSEGDLQTDVLAGIDLTIEKKERIAIVGASGSGKSTLLNLIGGLDRPTSGEVFIQDQRMDQLSEAARGQVRNRFIGFVYQFHHLLPEFTALENVAIPLLIRRESPGMAAKEATEILDKVGLGKRLMHKPGELSGGERQRCAIARALVTRPACVLADEPTGNLDPKTSSQVFNVMLEINQQFDSSLVVVTHDMEIASSMDRVLHIRDGKIHREK